VRNEVSEQFMIYRWRTSWFIQVP